MRKKLLDKLLILVLFTLGAFFNSAWGQAAVGTTLWAETWTDGTASEKPSQYGFEGTTVYGGTTLTYEQSSTNTKLYAETLAGGTSPELLLAKSSTTWTISNIPTGQATAMTLTFKSNKTTFSITSSTKGISISGSGTSWTISQSTDITNFNLTFTNTGSSNARIDDISLTVKTAGGAPTTCATPSFSPSAGAVTYGTAISISSATADATIYYTTNGDDPTTSSTVYDSENKPSITAATTIKAIAVKDGLTNSSVGSASYTIKAPNAPVFSVTGGIVEKGSTVTLTSATGTTIRYTTDGATTPTASVGTIYSSAITINADQTIKAVAYDAGGNCSSVVSYAFTAFAGTVVTFDASSDTGTSLSKNGVTFTTSATESDVYKWYKGSNTTFAVSNGKIKRIEFTGVSGYAISNMAAATGSLNTSDSPNGVWTGSVTSVKFTASTAQTRASKVRVFVATTATPTFSVATGEYSAAQSVELSCATDGATIYYTTDGTTPTSSSTAYSSAIPITTTTTLKAIAIYDGIESAVASATYTMNRPAAPTFDVEEGVFDAAFDLHLSTETDGATIYYTTNESTPTTSSSVYSTKVTISTATTTVKAIAVKSGLTSDVASATYTYDDRTTPTFTLSATSIDLKVNETSSAVTLTTNSDATPSFTCADAHVTLTGTGNSRTISANAAGTYTVTVSVTDSKEYKDASGTITVTVTKKATTMVLTPSFTSKDLYVTTSGILTGVVQYNSSDVDGATVTYSSSDEKVATINSSTGAVTFKKAGTTTLKASYAGTDEYEECEATYELTLTDTRPQETEVDITLNNTFFGCDAFTSYSKGDPTSYEGESDNVTVTYAKGTGSGFYCNTTGIRLYSGGSLTFEAPTGYVIIKIEMEGDDDFEAGLTNPEASTIWEGKDASVAITGETKKGSTRKNMTSATVTLAPTISVSSASWATYSSKHALDFTDVSTIYAYTATVSGDKVTFSRVKKVPANTGILLYSDGGVTNEAVPTLTGDADDVTGNLLVGTSTDIASLASSDKDYNYYILNNGSEGIGFYSANGQKVGAGKAYLKVSKTSDIRGFVPFDFDDVTSIQSVVKGNTSEDIIYDLQGRRVSNPRNGMYIVNGKKIFVK